jgi:hypothetical protein
LVADSRIVIGVAGDDLEGTFVELVPGGQGWTLIHLRGARSGSTVFQVLPLKHGSLTR